MTHLAKGIIDSLDKSDSDIDHLLHARELHKHATAVVNRVHSGIPHTAEVLAAFEHAYMLMKSMGLTDMIHHESDDDQDQPEPQQSTTEHFALVSTDQLGTFDGQWRPVRSIMERFATIDEAMESAATQDEGIIGVVELDHNDPTRGILLRVYDHSLSQDSE